MSELTSVENFIDFLKKPSSMYITSNWTFQRLLNVLKSSIGTNHNISVWATDIDYLTTELTEVKELTLYILGLETIEDIEEVKSILFGLKDAIELDFPNLKFSCKRKLNKPAYEIYSANDSDIQYESIDSVLTEIPETPITIAVPKHYALVKKPIIFLDEKCAEHYDEVKLTKGVLKVENLDAISTLIPYYVP